MALLLCVALAKRMLAFGRWPVPFCGASEWWWVQHLKVNVALLLHVQLLILQHQFRFGRWSSG
jgi:membrane protein YdbS with pleckstrin-like domain